MFRHSLRTRVLFAFGLIAVGNLVRNAFQHTPHNQGPVSVRIDQHEVSISNPSGLEVDDPEELGKRRSPGADTQGFGFGLNIVERLCEHNGWIFTLDVNRGAIHARLSWESPHLHADAANRRHASIVNLLNAPRRPETGKI